MNEEKLVTEVPSSLKQLARLVVRGFYSIEDALIVDMLVRNPCMKEDDICELLKFEKKQLRARIATLKNDKFIQVRLRMETGSDGKAQKYKLDLMRKRLETEERDATSRASFKCPGCLKTFTDLEADQLFDYASGDFHCTYCREVVEEDSSALPKKDSRLLLAKFNEQLDPLYILLREVEGIKLAPEVLEPEPVDISTIRGIDKKANGPLPGQEWSGEATRKSGFLVEEARVDITIGEESNSQVNRKEQPIWMTESTVIESQDSLIKASNALLESNADNTMGSTSVKNDDIMSVLLAHEKRPTNNVTANAVKGLNPDQSDSDSDDMMNEVRDDLGEIETMESEDEDDDHIPTVTVGNKTYPITEINDTIISEMTQAEKEIYVQVFQDYYSHINL